MMTVPELIDRLGGLKKLPAVLGVSAQAVSNMKSRRTIPPKHWLAVAKFAQEEGVQGIGFETLAQMNYLEDGAPEALEAGSEQFDA